MSRLKQLERKQKDFVKNMCANKGIDFSIAISGNINENGKMSLIWNQNQINKQHVPAVLMKLSEYIQLKEIADANKDRPKEQQDVPVSEENDGDAPRIITPW